MALPCGVCGAYGDRSKDCAGLSGENGPCAYLLDLKSQLSCNEPEVRLNEKGSLDEVCTSAFHLEQMDHNYWFLEIESGGRSVAVWLHAKGKISATYERRDLRKAKR
jgi:hypothetical protein